VRFYKSPRVLEKMEAGRRLIARLFERYTRDPSRLPTRTRARIDRDGVERVVCDYVSGMTDRYATRQAEA
jgi:dGTPase